MPVLLQILAVVITTQLPEIMITLVHELQHIQLLDYNYDLLFIRFFGRAR
jgi:hypothetical protein